MLSIMVIYGSKTLIDNLFVSAEQGLEEMRKLLLLLLGCAVQVRLRLVTTLIICQQSTITILL
jgi:hypothetical protein